MKNNKQSSVDYLISQLQKSKDWHRLLNEVSQMSSARVDIIAQAKAMHKEECVSYASDYARKMIQSNRIVTAEMIYNETYGGNNEN
jgi:transcriptional regulator of heat shock response